MKELRVNAIKNGTVIDHIPVKSVFKILEILKLDSYENEVLFGFNLVSKKHNKKSIIKISDKFFTKEEINKIAILAEKSTLNIVKNYDVVEKSKIIIPEKINSIIKCFNPNCITNHEKINTTFEVIPTNNLKLKCGYCEKIMEQEDIIII